MTEKLIHTVRTRNARTSLEAGFLAALLSFDTIRENMTIRGRGFARNLRWEFISPALLRRPKSLDADALSAHHEDLLTRGILYFNIGDNEGPGLIDHHGDENGLSSLDVLRNECDRDFLEELPWLLNLYLLVSDNDAYGTALSTGETIRTLMTGLSCMNMDDETTFEVLKLAFLGAFDRCQHWANEDGYIENTAKLSVLKHVKDGVKNCQPNSSEWFNGIVDKALATLKKDWDDACKDVDRAQDHKKTWKVYHPILSPILHRDLRVIAVRTKTMQAAKAARRRGYRYDLVIILGQGEYQIYSSFIAEWGRENGNKDAKIVRKWKFNLSAMARALRLTEANQEKEPEGEDWGKPGLIYSSRDNLIPGFLADYLSMVASRTLANVTSAGSSDVPDIFTTHRRVTQEAVESLNQCDLMVEADDGTWKHWPEKTQKRPHRLPHSQRAGGNGKSHPKSARWEGALVVPFPEIPPIGKKAVAAHEEACGE